MDNWMLRLLPLILTALSEPLRNELVKFATKLKAQAKQTDNPWDDIVADIFCWLLQID